jgi:hypothetical protein
MSRSRKASRRRSIATVLGIATALNVMTPLATGESSPLGTAHDTVLSRHARLVPVILPTAGNFRSL